MWKGKAVAPGVLAVWALACGPAALETTSEESKTAGPAMVGCQARIWPENNERTWPVSGNIVIH